MRPPFLRRSRNESARIGISSPLHIVIAAAIFALWLTAIIAGLLAWLK